MLEFLEEQHLYLYDGIIIPSATQILQKIFPNKYKGISASILSKKAKYGTKGHEVIEFIGKEEMLLETAKNYIKTLYEEDYIDKDLEISLREYIRLVEKNKIEVLDNELMIHYNDLYAGTLDMIAEVNGEYSLIDIKFTAQLDEEYLSWQLGMYKLAYENMYKKKFKNCYCLWFPRKQLGELRKIKSKTKKEILEKLEELC